MKNRIDKMFQNKKDNIVSVFFTGGYPQYDDTLKVVKALDEAGADLMEIGIPFSDPLADGKVIQESSSKAIANGMTLAGLFLQLSHLRNTTDKPVLLMGYLNSILQFGLESFYAKCHECGIDGVILPDLPIEEYIEQHQYYAEKYNIISIFLVSPTSQPARVEAVKRVAKGFVYLLSANSTTGNAINKLDHLKKIVPQLKLNLPVLIGFGIKDKASLEMACAAANGAIIGSEFIRRIKVADNLTLVTQNFINELISKHDYSAK